MQCRRLAEIYYRSAVMVYPDGTLYAQVQPSDVAEIIEEHIEKGKVVERLALMKL